MNQKQFEAFKKAWAEVPTQDNEYYVPDRGGFKYGWFAALEWMHDNEVVPRDELIAKMKEFCDHGLDWNMSRVVLFQAEVKEAINKFEKGGEG